MQECSHELRTPLTVIRTAAFNLKGNVARTPAQVERYGNLIQEESEKLTAIVEQVLRFASVRAGRVIGDRAPVAVGGLVDSVFRSRRHLLERCRIRTEKVDPDVPDSLADEAALKQALQNLLDNAVKYGAGPVQVSAATEGHAVRITVADRGTGIPAEEQPYIFDPFFRGQRAIDRAIVSHGTGLGLHLVKQIVEAHGGEIRVVRSDASTGAEFIFNIPAAPQEISNDITHSSHRG